MSDIASSYTQTAKTVEQAKTLQPYRTEETHWGYIVSATAGLGKSLRIAQGISMVLGAIFLAIVISLWLWPALTIGVDALLMRYFATVFFGGLAALFLWYASRGSRSEIHIDLSRGEVRDVIRNKTGKLTLLGSYGFDTVEDVVIEPSAASDEVDLVLRYATSVGSLVVASGRPRDLAALQARICKDVVIKRDGPASSGAKPNAAA